MARLEEVGVVEVEVVTVAPGGDTNIVMRKKGTGNIPIVKQNIFLSQYNTRCFIYGFSKLFYFIARCACSDCKNTNNSQKIFVISYVINCAASIAILYCTIRYVQCIELST